jgi:hypothetical protein
MRLWYEQMHIGSFELVRVLWACFIDDAIGGKGVVSVCAKADGDPPALAHASDGHGDPMEPTAVGAEAVEVVCPTGLLAVLGARRLAWVRCSAGGEAGGQAPESREQGSGRHCSAVRACVRACVRWSSWPSTSP